jgi:hypothetical protein
MGQNKWPHDTNGKRIYQTTVIFEAIIPLPSERIFVGAQAFPPARQGSVGEFSS